MAELTQGERLMQFLQQPKTSEEELRKERLQALKDEAWKEKQRLEEEKLLKETRKDFGPFNQVMVQGKKLLNESNTPGGPKPKAIGTALGVVADAAGVPSNKVSQTLQDKAGLSELKSDLLSIPLDPLNYTGIIAAKAPKIMANLNALREAAKAANLAGDVDKLASINKEIQLLEKGSEAVSGAAKAAKGPQGITIMTEAEQAAKAKPKPAMRAASLDGGDGSTLPKAQPKQRTYREIDDEYEQLKAKVEPEAGLTGKAYMDRLNELENTPEYAKFKAVEEERKAAQRSSQLRTGPDKAIRFDNAGNPLHGPGPQGAGRRMASVPEGDLAQSLDSPELSKLGSDLEKKGKEAATLKLKDKGRSPTGRPLPKEELPVGGTPVDEQAAKAKSILPEPPKDVAPVEPAKPKVDTSKNKVLPETVGEEGKTKFSSFVPGDKPEGEGWVKVMKGKVPGWAKKTAAAAGVGAVGLGLYNSAKNGVDKKNAAADAAAKDGPEFGPAEPSANPQFDKEQELKRAAEIEREKAMGINNERYANRREGADWNRMSPEERSAYLTLRSQQDPEFDKLPQAEKERQMSEKAVYGTLPKDAAEAERFVQEDYKNSNQFKNPKKVEVNASNKSEADKSSGVSTGKKFLLGVAKFFGSNGPEDFFDYASDPEGYLKKNDGFIDPKKKQVYDQLKLKQDELANDVNYKNKLLEAQNDPRTRRSMQFNDALAVAKSYYPNDEGAAARMAYELMAKHANQIARGTAQAKSEAKVEELQGVLKTMNDNEAAKKAAEEQAAMAKRLRS